MDKDIAKILNTTSRVCAITAEHIIKAEDKDAYDCFAMVCHTARTMGMAPKYIAENLSRPFGDVVHADIHATVKVDCLDREFYEKLKNIRLRLHLKPLKYVRKKKPTKSMKLFAYDHSEEEDIANAIKDSIEYMKGYGTGDSEQQVLKKFFKKGYV